jgi:hypothetical protein
LANIFVTLSLSRRHHIALAFQAKTITILQTNRAIVIMKITLTTPFLYQNPQTGSPSTTTLICTQLCRLLCPPTTSTSDTTIRPSSFLNPSTRILGYNSHTQSYNVEGWQMANQVDVIREACDFWYYETQKCRVDTTKQTKSSSDAAVGNNNDAVENQDEAATTATATVIEGPISTRALSKLYHVDKLISGATRVYRNSSSLAAVAGGATAGDCGDGGGTATNNNNGGSNDNQSTQQQQQHKHEGWKEIHQLDNLQMAMEAFREVVEMPSSWLVNDNHAEVGADALTTSAGGDAGGDASQNASNNMSRSGVNHGADNNVEQMTFDGDDIATNNNDVRSNNNNADDDDDVLQQQQQQEQTVADELEAFLSSTDHLAPHAANTTSTGADDDDDQEEYESDGGTRYIRDCQSGNWIHEALMMQQQQQQRRGNNGVTNGSRNSGGGGDQRAVQSNISNIEAVPWGVLLRSS